MIASQLRVLVRLLPAWNRAQHRARSAYAEQMATIELTTSPWCIHGGCDEDRIPTRRVCRRHAKKGAAPRVCADCAAPVVGLDRVCATCRVRRRKETRERFHARNRPPCPDCGYAKDAGAHYCDDCRERRADEARARRNAKRHKAPTEPRGLSQPPAVVVTNDDT